MSQNYTINTIENDNQLIDKYKDKISCYKWLSKQINKFPNVMYYQDDKILCITQIHRLNKWFTATNMFNRYNIKEFII